MLMQMLTQTKRNFKNSRWVDGSPTHAKRVDDQKNRFLPTECRLVYPPTPEYESCVVKVEKGRKMRERPEKPGGSGLKRESGWPGQGCEVRRHQWV